MKLIYAAASPFARKVRVVAHETGQFGSLELLDTTVLPTQINQQVLEVNPLGKIPVLVTDDGQSLFDSRVICEYLDSLHAGQHLIPTGARRWPVLRVSALADGVLDAALLVRYETVIRPDALRWNDWLDGQWAKVERGLDELESLTSAFGAPLDLGQISVGCALGYLDFRFPDRGWRDGHPGLEAFQAAFSQRPSMQVTAPTG